MDTVDFSNINAFDGDGHVEEWEETWSDKYLDAEFRDRRPVVVETGENERDYKWDIEGELFRIGGSPSSKDGVVSTEYVKMAKWRGPHESGEFHTAKDRLAVMDAEDTLVSINYPTLLLQWPIAKDPLLNQALTRSYNNWVADISSQAPDRLKWVTVICPSDPEEAAREMIRTQKMGSVGVMVLGDYNEKALDHPEFEIIWQTANDIGMPVNVHPGTGALKAWADYPSVASDQFLMSVVRGFKTICSSGILGPLPRREGVVPRDRLHLGGFRHRGDGFHPRFNPRAHRTRCASGRTQADRRTGPAQDDTHRIHQGRADLHRVRGR